MLLRCLFFLLTVAVVSAPTLGQSSDGLEAVPSGEANTRLVKRLNPATPPLAQSARICGIVTLSITISATGDVSDYKLIRGHPILVPAAVNAIKGWKYKPFEANGIPIAVTTQADVAFPCESQIVALERFYPPARKCHDLVEHADYNEAESECRKALKFSDSLPKELVSERSSIRTLLATAILSQRRPAEAIPLYQEALELDKRHLDPDDVGLASDYFRLGDAYSHTGQLSKADELYGTAVSILEAAVQKWPVMKPDYTRRLTTYLQQYAAIKESEGQSDAAQQLRAKARDLAR